MHTTAQVSTAMSRGATFDAVLERDLVVDGTVIARRGALVTCVMTSSDPGGKVKGVASLTVGARAIDSVAGPLAVKTSSYGAEARSTKGKDATRTGIATGAGALIGAIAGGGKGAAIGTSVGAGAGVGVSMATRGDAAIIPAETLIEFRLAAAGNGHDHAQAALSLAVPRSGRLGRVQVAQALEQRLAAGFAERGQVDVGGAGTRLQGDANQPHLACFGANPAARCASRHVRPRPFVRPGRVAESPSRRPAGRRT